MYCKRCHKQKPDDHFTLYPDHDIPHKLPTGGTYEAQPPPSAARTPRAPRVPVGAAPYDTSEGGGNAGMIFLGVAALGGIGYGIYKWWKSRGEGGGEGAAPA